MKFNNKRMMSFLNGKSLMITGGTGSLGNSIVDYIIKNNIKPKRLVIFSRDELKQSNMQKKYSNKKYKFMRYFLGDIRDKDRLVSAIENVEYIIHTAALKQVPASEYNPFETIKTNILGAQNIIDACLKSKVKKVIALSTDKASSPINLYGATKLCSDKLFVAANNYRGKNNTIFSVVRYGNVFGSRGSVLPLFLELKNKNYFTVTDKKMTRFSLTLDECIKTIIWTMKNSFGAEIVIPKIPSYKILDLCKSINEKATTRYIGKRPGEKLHEEMISDDESENAISIKDYYVILQSQNKAQLNFYKKTYNGKFKLNKSYNSFNNKDYLSVNDLKKLISNYKKTII